MQNPYDIVKMFESELCRYTGARFAVTVTSCSMALLLACKWFKVDAVIIPSRTYVSVPQSIIHASGVVIFDSDLNGWQGSYRLLPYPIYDCARRFTSGMYIPGQFQCLSFHPSKILGLSGHGGAILHDDPEADKWFRKARFDGRTEGVAPKDDDITMIGYHCYMAPETAAQGLMRLSLLPLHNDDLKNSDYPDLSKMEVFR